MSVYLKYPSTTGAISLRKDRGKRKSDQATESRSQKGWRLKARSSAVGSGSIWYEWFHLQLRTKCGTNLFTLLSFCSMAQTVQKGHKSVASGSRRRQEDSSDSSPVPVPAKKTKTATARKSTGGKPPNRRQRDEVVSAAPRGRTSSHYNNALFT